MSSQLVPVITDNGREALIEGFSTPNNYRFSQVALGDANKQGYDPKPQMTELSHEMQRVDISSVIVQDKARLHITAVVGEPGEAEASNTVDEYEIREIGFYLQRLNEEGKNQGDAILFAIYSSTNEKPLMSKERATELLLAFDLVLPDVVEGDMSFDDKSYLHLPLASEDAAGLLRVATESETLQGSDTGLAVSPASLHKALATQFADQKQINDGKSSSLAVTPAGLKSVIDKVQAGVQQQSPVVDGKLSLQKDAEIVFADNGQLRSLDNNHRILFRRTENILELREWGKIVLSPGSKKGQETAKLTLEENGALDVQGEINAGNSDLYFTHTGHNHTGKGNAEGFAAIENAKNYEALMILGRSIKGKGRRVKLWDHLQVNGNLDVTGVIEQQAWIDAAMENGWVRYSNDYNPPQYFKDSMGIVHLRGLVKGGAIGQSVFTLPAGYRPQFRELLCTQSHPNIVARLDIAANGQVVAMTGNSGWFSLDGATFRAV